MEFTQHSIRKLIESIQAGHIRIPAFQRGFVWDHDRVAHLLDSIYKRYPFGSLLFWRTKNRLTTERKLGPFSLPEARDEFPVDYVLDGQQRITSLYCVFQTEIKWPDDEERWPGIYFTMDSDDDFQESQFVVLADEEVDEKKHFPVSTLFDVVKYREATNKFSNNSAVIKKLDDLQQRFKEANIPIQVLSTEERSAVAIVFERINRLGVELDTLQLLSAWTWNDDFSLIGSFKELKEDLEEFGFSEVGEDSNLILRCSSAILRNDPSPDKLLEMKGADIRASFPKIKNGIKGAIDFLRTELSIRNIKNLPYDAMLTPLATFFAVEEGKDVHMTDHQRKTLKKWFWRTCFSNRYSSQTRRTAQKDIHEMIKLRVEGRSKLADFDVNLSPNFFTANQFRTGTATTKTFILMLAQQAPCSFISGNVVDLDKVLQKYNRAEFHHVYPRAFLKNPPVKTDENLINALGNFAIINGVDNRAISGAAPSIYRKKMPKAAAPMKKIQKRALCPSTMFNDDFVSFLEKRNALLIKEAERLIKGA